MKRLIKRGITLFVMLVVLVSSVLTTEILTPLRTGAAVEGAFGYTVSDGKATITEYYGLGGDVEIPAEIAGYPVENIGYDAFKECSWITSVIFPEGILRIYADSFYGCSSLQSVFIPDSVIYIGHAFGKCNSLKSILVGENNSTYYSEGNCIIEVEDKKLIQGCNFSIIPNGVKSIADSAFRDCEFISYINLPDGLTHIGFYAFQNCISLSEIDFPDNLVNIGGYAFRNCTSIESIKLSSSYIGLSAFADCSSLKNVTFCEGLTIIREFAFHGCSQLTSVYIPQSVTKIETGVFKGCPLLASIVVDRNNTTYYSANNCLIRTAGKELIQGCKNSIIPSDIKKIGSYAFSGCRGLQSIVIPDTVTWIGGNAFEKCDSLLSVRIPKSVVDIYGRAFWECGSLKTIYCEAAAQPTGWLDGWLEGCNATVILGCSPRPTLSEDSAALFIAFLTDKGALSETTIKDSILYKTLTSVYEGTGTDYAAEAAIVYILATMDELADRSSANTEILNKELIAFLEREMNRHSGLAEEVLDECMNVASKKLTEGIAEIVGTLVTSSSERIFDTLAVYNAVTSVKGAVNKGKVFADRSIAGIKASLAVLESEKAGRYTYFNRYLSSRGSFKSPDEELFKLLMSTERQQISDKYWMSSLLNSLTWLTGKDSFTNHYDLLDEWAEYVYQLRCYCNERKNVALHDSMESEVEYAQTTTGVEIIHCPQKTGTLVSIPSQINGNNVVSIGNNAFENCNEIVEISMGETVQSIGENAFYGCEELSTVILGANVQTISDRAFENCTKLETVVVSSPISEIGDEAFLNCSDNLNIVCECNNATVVSYCTENNIKYTLVHIFEDYIPNQDATCSEYGTSTATCFYCTETDTQTDYGSLEEHCWVYGEPQESQDNDVLLQEKSCSICGEVAYVCFSRLVFAGASITLFDDLTVNFKADAALFETYTDPYVVFVQNGIETTVTEYAVEDGYYVFAFADILPNQMNDEITATMYATLDGTVYMSEAKAYSVATYCYNMLDKYSDDEKLRTLLVDILNYGAATQEYTGHNTANLANAGLTDAQKAWASPDRAFVSVENVKYAEIASPAVTWIGAGLNLSESIAVRYEFTTASTDGLTAKVTCGGKTWEIAEFSKNEQDKDVLLVYINAGYMNEPIYVTLYDGETAVSDTVCYSIESYASTYGEDAELGALVKAMMKYGDAASAYITKG